jgi:Flp pilus assembly protein TadB
MSLDKYVRRCIQISLAKRWWQPLLSLVAVTTVVLLAGLPVVTAVLSGVVAATIATAWIVLSSWRRHRRQQSLVLNFSLLKSSDT